MKHNYKINGYSYRLRPVGIEDAQFIVDTRLEDSAKCKFVHKISEDINLQIAWLENYFNKEGDYYFVIENLFTNEKEGLISIYNLQGKKAEWGRWVLRNGSLAAVESVNLLYQLAFDKLNLEEVYTKTVQNNTSVVNFHKSINAKFRKVIEKEFELEGIEYNAVEQYVDKSYYYSDIKKNLNDKSIKLFERNVKNKIGKFKLHHIGVATDNIEKELKKYSYQSSKSDYFEDERQGVKGLFINSEKTKLELLENLADSHTLDFFIQNNLKEYHYGYYVDNLEKAFNYFTNQLNAKIVSDIKNSVYFESKICFLMLRNKVIIELIESIIKNDDK